MYSAMNKKNKKISTRAQKFSMIYSKTEPMFATENLLYNKN